MGLFKKSNLNKIQPFQNITFGKIAEPPKFTNKRFTLPENLQRRLKKKKWCVTI